jgi:hypothetical protein
MDAQGILFRFYSQSHFQIDAKDVIWSWRGLCFIAGMNVRRRSCGRGKRLDVVRTVIRQKTKSICA